MDVAAKRKRTRIMAQTSTPVVFNVPAYEQILSVQSANVLPEEWYVLCEVYNVYDRLIIISKNDDFPVMHDNSTQDLIQDDLDL